MNHSILGFMQMPRLKTYLAFLLGMFVFAGCTHYEYAIVEPANLAQTIGRQTARVNYPPVEYEFSEQEKRIVMAVKNTTDNPIILVSSRSYLVDPNGQTHSLKGSIIAPRSYIGMAMPPPPIGYQASPYYGFGLGYGYPYSYGPYFNSRYGYYGSSFYDPWPAGYSYYPVYGPDHWTWKTGQVRMRLFYEGGSTNGFVHNFLFERRPVQKPR